MRGISRRSRRWIACAALSGMGVAGGLGIAATPSSAAVAFCHNGQVAKHDGAFCAAAPGNNTAFAKAAPGGDERLRPLAGVVTQ